jgi:hypothetical protein
MTIRTFIVEFIQDHLNELSDDDYQRMIHTGELPKIRVSKKSKTPAKSFDDLHSDFAKVRKVEKDYGGFNFHYTTSSSTPKTILKKSGWEHTSGPTSTYGVGSKLVYTHPDGHTATYYHDSRRVVLKKKI